jgi:flagellar biosynthesis protein FlhA
MKIRLSESAIGFLVIGIVIIIVIPLPSAMLDFLFITNIGLGLTILLTSLYVKEPLQFSSFPTLLLIATLFRLALNISSTRLILSNGGYAGKVIATFGEFVVKGNVVVGLIIFLIIIVIQFVVITKGSERVSEVSARFTLDSMPGKQMAIDADLNAGLIDEQQARARRRKIEDEANFYGAMDGASKFVKGDAIAGIIITVINLVGGVVIGILSGGMTITVRS